VFAGRRFALSWRSFRKTRSVASAVRYRRLVISAGNLGRTRSAASAVFLGGRLTRFGYDAAWRSVATGEMRSLASAVSYHGFVVFVGSTSRFRA